MPIKRTYASHGDACSTSHAMELLGDRWTYPAIRELMLGPKRFSELQTALRGITPAVLTTRVRELERSGLVQRVTLPAPASSTAYAITEWAAELRPVFEALARWALKSPVRDVTGCGLTPDAIVQSMLTMAPRERMDPPLDLALHLADGRVGGSAIRYAYRLRWAQDLSIERGSAQDPQATVTGDSSAWTGVLYQGFGLDVMEVTGDTAAVQRLVAAFDGVLQAATASAAVE
ncbi:winged helix-turn-helix transcriptional regulator [Pseudactinotalea sp. Z1748]|uniref:winged helix-turn-helix transcriptional regulator n=1 Tax=Pseudactinotalea sp. Z1748 TaxID=3413027 RepID=UPI003C7B44AB